MSSETMSLGTISDVNRQGQRVRSAFVVMVAGFGFGSDIVKR
jgi:hypothetical protein